MRRERLAAKVRSAPEERAQLDRWWAAGEYAHGQMLRENCGRLAFLAAALAEWDAENPRHAADPAARDAAPGPAQRELQQFA
eukprot:gene8243-1070_t